MTDLREKKPNKFNVKLVYTFKICFENTMIKSEKNEKCKHR